MTIPNIQKYIPVVKSQKKRKQQQTALYLVGVSRNTMAEVASNSEAPIMQMRILRSRS